MDPSVEPIVCSRCGAFATASVDGVCSECRPKILIEPLRGPLTVSCVWRATASVLGVVGVPAVLVTFAFALPGLLLFTALPDLPRGVQRLYSLVELVAELAVMVLSYEAAHGRTITLAAAFERVSTRYGAVLVTRWLSQLFAVLWALLLLLPGLYKLVAYAFSEPIALFEERGYNAAIDLSIERTRSVLLLLTVTVGAPLVLALLWAFGAYALVGVAVEEGMLYGTTFAGEVLIASFVAVPAQILQVVAIVALIVVYARTALDARTAKGA